MVKTMLETIKGELVALGLEIKLLLRFSYDKENPQVAILNDALRRAEKLKIEISTIIKRASQHALFASEEGETLESQIETHYNSLMTFIRETNHLLSQLTPTSTTNSTNSTPSSSHFNINLPTLKLTEVRR